MLQFKKIESYLIWSRMSMVALCMIMHKILLMNFRLWVGFNKTCTINPDHYACTKPKAATESRIKLNTRRVCSTLGHPPTATENRDESWSLRTRAPDGRALVRTSMQPLSVCLLRSAALRQTRRLSSFDRKKRTHGEVQCLLPKLATRSACCCVPCFRPDLMCSATSSVAHCLMTPECNLIKICKIIWINFKGNVSKCFPIFGRVGGVKKDLKQSQGFLLY